MKTYNFVFYKKCLIELRNVSVVLNYFWSTLPKKLLLISILKQYETINVWELVQFLKSLFLAATQPKCKSMAW